MTTDTARFNFSNFFAETTWEISTFVSNLEDQCFPIKEILPQSFTVELHRSVIFQSMVQGMNYKIAFHTFVDKLMTYLQAAKIIGPDALVPEVDGFKELINYSLPVDTTRYDFIYKSLADLQETVTAISQLDEFQKAILESMLSEEAWSKCVAEDLDVLQLFKAFMHEFRHKLNIHIFGYEGDELVVNTNISSYIILDYTNLCIDERYQDLVYRCISEEHLKHHVFPADVYKYHPNILFVTNKPLIKEVLMMNALKSSAIQAAIPSMTYDQRILKLITDYSAILEAVE